MKINFKKSIVFVFFAIILFTFIGCNTNNNIDETNATETLQSKNKVMETIPTEPKNIEIDLIAVGDIMCHPPQTNAAKIGENEYDFTPNYKYVKKHIENANIAFGNYETVTFSEKPLDGYPVFNSPIETVEALKDTGFDVLSTANNHSLDQGKGGIISTIEAIENNGMKHIGTSAIEDPKPLIVDVEGIKIGVMSYTFGLNGLDSRLTPDELNYMINLIDEEKIQKDIEYLKENKVDTILSYIHWGYEYNREPSQEQIDLGKKLVDWGVNIVIGSHPHVLQRPEIIEKDGKNNLIIYSMGNFISNQRQEYMGMPYTEDGIMVKLNLEKNMKTMETTIKKIEYIPTWVYKYNDGVKNHYEILPTKEVVSGELEIEMSPSTRERVEKSYNDVATMFGME